MIVNCSSYIEGRKVADVSIDSLAEVLADDGQFVWIGLHEPTEELLRQVQRLFGLHDLAVEDAHNAHQRPKLEEYGDGLFVVLRTARETDGQVELGETHLFVGPRYVVTVRHGPSVGYGELRLRCESTPHLLKKGPGFVLYAIMDFVVDHFFPILDDTEEALEALEDAIFGSAALGRDATQRIYGLKRDLMMLKRAVSPLVDVCNRLVRFDRALIPEDTRVYFRDVYDHVIRINDQIDNQRELLTTALEANLSLIAVRQNDVMKRLAAWAAILAFPTLFVGIYGMNFENMPETHWTYGYPLAWGVMVAGSGGLWAWFKRLDWL
jgi:magnesium transporter